MPAKGSKFSLGNRDYVFNKEFYEENLVDKHNITFSKDQCKEIIETCNKNIASIIVDEIDGFKMPFGLGYICAGKFKSKQPAIDWKKTKEVGKKVYFLNFHSSGYSVRSFWFRIGRIKNTKFHEVYRFVSYRALGRAISAAFTSGKQYSEWKISDFLEIGRLENFYNKKYRKEQKE